MTLRSTEILDSPPDATQPNEPPRSSQQVPWVTASFIAACVLVFVLTAYQGGPSTSGLFEKGILFGPAIRENHQWFRVLTTLFTHANALHLFFNMLSLWNLGSALERAAGSARFLLISLVTAAGSACMILAFSFDKPTVGASGMIIGYLGAMLMVVNASGRRQLLSWVIQLVVISLLPNVSWQGHLGGFLAGLPLGWALRGGPQRFSWAAPLLMSATCLALLLIGRGDLG